MSSAAVILGALIEANGHLPPTLARLLECAPDSFNDPRHGATAVAIRTLRAAGKAVHVLSVAEALTFADSTSFVSDLANSALSLDLAELEAQTQWQQYRDRRARTVLSEADRALTASPRQAGDIIARAGRELDRLAIDSANLPQARTIGTLTLPDFADPNELLLSRYLCRGGGLLLVGQSGQGKSSLAMQMAILWSIGRPCFGIAPAHELRILVIQAENDDGDLAEMFQGICNGLQLSPDHRQAAGDRILLFNEDALAGEAFIRLVARLVEAYRPDIVVIDPALAYVGGDTKDAEAVGEFLRRGLNPILHRHNCAALVVHHTTKQRNEGPQVTHDFLYSGAGSIEWSNWSRAVLSLETKGNGCYALHAPKRGRRIGWRNAHDECELVRFVRHSRIPGAIFWTEVDAEELQAAVRTGKSKSDLLAHVPTDGSIGQKVLLEKASTAGIGEKKARAFLDELLSDGTVHLWSVKRKGTNPEKRISRQCQPDTL